MDRVLEFGHMLHAVNLLYVDFKFLQLIIYATGLFLEDATMTFIINEDWEFLRLPVLVSF